MVLQGLTGQQILLWWHQDYQVLMQSCIEWERIEASVKWNATTWLCHDEIHNNQLYINRWTQRWRCSQKAVKTNSAENGDHVLLSLFSMETLTRSSFYNHLQEHCARGFHSKKTCQGAAGPIYRASELVNAWKLWLQCWLWLSPGRLTMAACPHVQETQMQFPRTCSNCLRPLLPATVACDSLL